MFQEIEQAVKATGTLTPSQKLEVKRVFLDKLGDLNEYASAKDSWRGREIYIGLQRQKISDHFRHWKKQLRDQLDFTWDDLMTGAPKSMFQDGAKDDTYLYEDNLEGGGDDVTTTGATNISNYTDGTDAHTFVPSSLVTPNSGPESSSGLSGLKK